MYVIRREKIQVLNGQYFIKNSFKNIFEAIGYIYTYWIKFPDFLVFVENPDDFVRIYNMKGIKVKQK